MIVFSVTQKIPKIIKNTVIFRMLILILITERPTKIYDLIVYKQLVIDYIKCLRFFKLKLTVSRRSKPFDKK